jgi:hypothetical protein
MRERMSTIVALIVGGVLLVACAVFAWLRSSGRM